MDLFDELNKMIDSELSKIEVVNVEEATHKQVEVGDKILNTFIFGGGVPLGSMITFTGHSSSFKSTLSLNIVSLLMKKYSKKFYLIYLDSESSMTKERIKSMGIDDNFYKIYSGLTVENVNSIINTLSKIKREKKEFSNISFIVIWDSIASTPCDAELSTDDINKTLGLKARLLSAFIPRWKNNILIKDDITLITINQMREKVALLPFQQGGGNLKNLSSDKTLPGGLAAQYLSDILIEQKVAEKFDETNSPYGIRAYRVELKTVKNKFFPDNIRISLIFNPQFGYLKEFTEFEFLKYKKSLIQIGGGYYTFEMDGGSYKFRVKELMDKMKDEKFRNSWNKLLDIKLKEEENFVKSQKIQDSSDS